MNEDFRGVETLIRHFLLLSIFISVSAFSQEEAGRERPDMNSFAFGLEIPYSILGVNIDTNVLLLKHRFDKGVQLMTMLGSGAE